MTFTLDGVPFFDNGQSINNGLRLNTAYVMVF
jgi:hypothetical protein